MSNLILAALVCCAPMTAANIVQDGTFENGGGAWTVSGAQTSILNAPGQCHLASNFCAQFDNTQAQGVGVVSQFVPTVTGANYTISFWLMNSTSTTVPDNQFHLQWDNVIPINFSDDSPFPWTFHSVNVLATSNSMWLSFQGINNNGFFLLDDVTVEGPDGRVPEPASLLLGAAGLILIGAVKLRHRYDPKVNS